MIRFERWSALVICLLVVTTSTIPVAAAQEGQWRASLGAGQTWFSGGVTDTTNSGIDFTLTPAVSWALAADRQFGHIRLGVQLSYLSANAQATGPALRVVDPNFHLRQWGVTALLTLPVLRAGTGGAGLSLSAGPALGWWNVTDADSRTTFGGVAALQFAAPITPGWKLLASAGGSVSGSPFEAGELPVEYIPATLWSGQVGLGVQYAF